MLSFVVSCIRLFLESSLLDDFLAVSVVASSLAIVRFLFTFRKDMIL